MNNILKISDVRKVYGPTGQPSRAALDGVSFTVTKGEFVAVMGPSGSGKTTLLNMLAGIDTPTSGEVTINGQTLSDLSSEVLAKFRRTQLGFVFQDYNLLETLTIGENIALPLLLEGKPASKRLNSTMQRLGIETLESRFPYQVSGGQQQRAAVARAIVHEPSLVLADEPSGNLDSKAANDLLKSFSALNRDLQVTFVMVTHDPHAASYAQRIIFIKDGQVYDELKRQTQSKEVFYKYILEVLGQLESGASRG